MSKHVPVPLTKLQELRKPMRNANIAYRERLTRLDRVAIFIADQVGSIGFFFIIAGWTIFWISWNTLAPAGLRFDPFPAFVMWLFISNMIQILLMPLIMVGQNLQGRHSEARAEADFDINIKAEREIETILQHLENQNELILKILDHLERKSEQ